MQKTDASGIPVYRSVSRVRPPKGTGCFPPHLGHSRNTIDSGNAYDVLLPVPFRTA